MSEPRNHFTGSCLCGQVSYQVHGPLRPVIACHCNQCRKTSGHHVAATSTPTDKLAIEGIVSWYQSSDYARRGFCSTCGGNLFWQPGDRSRTAIFAGTLDGPTGLYMTSQIHGESKGDYYSLPDVPEVEQPPA